MVLNYCFKVLYMIITVFIVLVSIFYYCLIYYWFFLLFYGLLFYVLLLFLWIDYYSLNLFKRRTLCSVSFKKPYS